MKFVAFSIFLWLAFSLTASAFSYPKAEQSLASHLVTKVKILGSDTRRRVPKQYRTLAHGVGWLQDTVRNYFCTAFCVAPNVIITNAHCLAWGLKKKYHKTRNLRDFSFRLYRNGRQTRKTKLRWNLVDPIGNPYLSTLGNWPAKTWTDSAYRDWIAAKIRDDICRGHELILAEETAIEMVGAAGGMEAFMIGFHADKTKRAKVRSYSKCAIAGIYHSRENALAHHTCDAGRSSSGSPIFVEMPDGPRVIAFHKGWTTFKRPRYVRFGAGRAKPYKRINLAILPFALLQRLPRFRDAKLIEKRTKLKRIVGLLKVAGYLDKRASEKFGIDISDALVRFGRGQVDFPLGIPTQQLLKNLKEATEN